MKNIYKFNCLSRFLFLLLTPVFFQYFALGFIWHSIFKGVVTFCLLIWIGFIVMSPFIGRIGCGWFCFMGTISDFVSKRSFLTYKRRKSKQWLRCLIFIVFFGTAFLFYFLNKNRGMAHNFNIIPFYFELNFDIHYKIVWIVDIIAASLIALFFNKRWACKNICVIGSLCSIGANHSRLLPVIDSNCINCGKCEKECIAGIHITEYIKENNGLVSDSECILCGKCADVCSHRAVEIKFIWNREKYNK